MEYLNLIISIVAIILSIVAIVFGWHQHSIQSNQRKCEIISDLILSLKKFSHTYEIMLHEREKTGSEIIKEEAEMFSRLDSFEEVSVDLTKKMTKALQNKKLKLDEQAISQALIVKQYSESLTTWLEFRHDRFKRFNDNKVSELKEPFEKLSAIFGNQT